MSENRIAPEILELIRRTSTVRGCSNVFSLAPRGHRVGFYFQQRRATLLAKALLDRLGEAELRTAEIAVVGAGVTGVSFFLSLLHFGARNVCLYEASDGLLKTGAAAAHRLVHPNYNRWPTLGSMDIFTSLPVLNWWAGTGKAVVEQLRSSIAKRYSGKIKDKFRPNHRCISVTQQGPELANPVKVQFECGGIQTKENFKFVVLSVGFGDEDCKAWDLEDYWTTESIPLDIDVHKRAVRVFGTGDGALIDILRCCAKTPDDAWVMPLGLIGGLRVESATVLQEDKVSGPVDSRTLPFTDWEIEIQQHEESIRSASWPIVKKSDKATTELYVEQEQDFYRNLVRRLKRKELGLCDFLEARLKPVAEPALKPKLFGALAAPFEPTSAPINKLLVAYLLETNRILYEKKTRTETKAELDRIKIATRSTSAASIDICRYGASRNFPPTARGGGINAVDVIVALNGTALQLDETDLEGQLIDLLSGLSGGEYVYFDAMPHPMELARNGYDKERIAHSTRERFKPIMDDFASDVLKANVVLKDSPPKWVIKTEMNPDEMKEKLRFLGGLDGVFCGAPIVVSRKATPEKLEREGF